MSQDHLFSAFKRPRETLSAVNNTNNNNNNMYGSGLPQPASSMKRQSMAPRPSSINSRMSMAPSSSQNSRASVAGGFAGMGAPATVGRGSVGFSAAASSRKSYAPTSSQPPPSARRSSVYGRPSVGYAHGTSFFSAAPTSSVKQDPRPLKDPAYKSKMISEVTDYLLHNGFEMDMQYTLNQNALKSPTQKDFSNIFAWLYQRLDPGYKFIKVENEVLQLMKNLKYPYGQNVSKSSLAAVGSQNAWPTFLGMLHWLMELAQVTDRCMSGELDDQAASEGNVDIAGEKIMFKYITQCYNAWLQEDDDHEAFEQEMAAAFDERHSAYTDEAQMLEAENARLLAEVQELEAGGAPLETYKKEANTLSSDIEKFAAYIQKRQEKIDQYKDTNKAYKEQVTQLTQTVTELEHQKADLQTQVDAQGLTPADIDRMNSDREKLNRGLSQISTKLMEAQQKLTERETEAQSKLEALERAVSRYNSLAYSIGITPSSAPNASGKEFELIITPLADKSLGESGKLLIDSQTGYPPTQLLNRDLRNDIKPSLTKLRQDIGVRIHEAQDNAMKTQEFIERITEALTDRKDELETLNARLSAVSNEYQDLKETSQAEINTSNALLEKQQAGLQDMRVSTRRGHLETEQRLQAVKMEYDRFSHAAGAVRDQLHSNTKRIVEDVIDFKVHVQKNLSEYEERVEGELREHYPDME